MKQNRNLAERLQSIGKLNLLFLLCAFVQIPLALAEPMGGCFPPPFFESRLGLAVSLSLAAIALCLNHPLGNIGAAGWSGILFYRHFYWLPIYRMELWYWDDRFWNNETLLQEVMRYWVERLEYDPTAILQIGFTAVFFCYAVTLLLKRLLSKPSAFV